MLRPDYNLIDCVGGVMYSVTEVKSWEWDIPKLQSMKHSKPQRWKNSAVMKWSNVGERACEQYPNIQIVSSKR